MTQSKLVKFVTGAAFMVFASLLNVTSAHALLLYVVSTDGVFSEIAYTDSTECSNKFYEQCVKIHPDCGGSPIYTGQNISRLLNYWNDRGTSFLFSPSPNGTSAYCTSAQ